MAGTKLTATPLTTEYQCLLQHGHKCSEGLVWTLPRYLRITFGSFEGTGPGSLTRVVPGSGYAVRPLYVMRVDYLYRYWPGALLAQFSLSHTPIMSVCIALLLLHDAASQNCVAGMDSGRIIHTKRGVTCPSRPVEWSFSVCTSSFYFCWMKVCR